jgi:tRNA pseudouridine55 synthase
VVDKPAGPTSHDIVDRVRRALGVRRVGHTGTLDPFATGVLPVCVGRATRLARFLTEGEKEYEATVRLGFATTTDDATGAPLGPPRPVAVSREQVEGAARGFVGRVFQTPPSFSAKHIGGGRAYERARKGEPVALPPREVTVYVLQVLETADDRLRVLVRCSAGTYIRALGRDLGAALGTGGHLADLRRTRAGGFGLERAVPADALAPSSRNELVPMGQCLTGLPAVVVTEEGRQAVTHGRPLAPSHAVSGFPEGRSAGRVRILDAAGELLALAVPEDARGFGPETVLQPDVVLFG